MALFKIIVTEAIAAESRFRTDEYLVDGNIEAACAWRDEVMDGHTYSTRTRRGEIAAVHVVSPEVVSFSEAKARITALTGFDTRTR
jgi:hypothetical protein